MSIKSLIQIIILLIIFVILGSVYFKYFSTANNIVEETSEIETENYKTNTKVEVTDQNNSNSSLKSKNVNEKIENENLKVDKEKQTTKLKNQKITKSEEGTKIKNTKEQNNKDKKKHFKNLVKDVEYLTADKNGNEYKILATSGKTNLENNSILDLNNVRGVVTSKNREPIYIISDFAEYDSSSQNSKFYQNVVINYENKEITCDNFDINMETNIAVAYNNVKVTDPKSVMYAGEITLDIETKDININPERKESKVKVITE